MLFNLLALDGCLIWQSGMAASRLLQLSLELQTVMHAVNL